MKWGLGWTISGSCPLAVSSPSMSSLFASLLISLGPFSLDHLYLNPLVKVYGGEIRHKTLIVLVLMEDLFWCRQGTRERSRKKGIQMGGRKRRVGGLFFFFSYFFRKPGEGQWTGPLIHCWETYTWTPSLFLSSCSVMSVLLVFWMSASC